LNFAKSASASIGAKTTSAVTGPFVPGDHAFGYPSTGYACGATTCAANRSFDQPRPNVPHGSSLTFASPHSFMVFSAHPAAARMLGEPVGRGP
jgi:hypothetical protein